MLGCTVKGFTRPCSPVTGGVDRLFVGDSNDFDFTSDTPVDGDPTGYAAIALHTGALTASGAFLYEIDSLVDTIGVDITQSNPDGSSSSYEYTIAARLAQMTQAMTNFNYKLDSAAVCCQLLFVWVTNDGHIFVVGEKYVDADVITRFRLRNDGSRFSSGKKFTDFNGQDLSIKGTYSRLPYEFTGTIGDIEAMAAA